MATSVIKANYEVDKKAGNSITISEPYTIMHGSFNLVRCFVPFPFYAKNTNYSVTNISINVVNVGALTGSVYFKTQTGVAIQAPVSGASGAYLADSLSLKVTFA